MFGKFKSAFPKKNPWGGLFKGIATRRLFKAATGVRVPRIFRTKWTP